MFWPGETVRVYGAGLAGGETGTMLCGYHPATAIMVVIVVLYSGNNFWFDHTGVVDTMLSDSFEMENVVDNVCLWWPDERIPGN